jgi:hypothetical protein
MARPNIIDAILDNSITSVTERLVILLPNVVTGTGKATTVTGRRYLYMYKSDPDNLYLSSERLTGPEPGIRAFWLSHWDSSGLQVYSTAHKPTDHAQILELIQDLGSEGIFQEITKSYSLNALLGMGYISNDLILDTIKLTAQAQRLQLLQAETMVNEGVEAYSMPQLNLTQAVQAVKDPKYLKSANPSKIVDIKPNPSTPRSEHDTTDHRAYTQEAIAPSTNGVVPKGWANTDLEAEGELDIVTDDGEVKTLKDAMPKEDNVSGESTSGTPSTVDTAELERLAAQFAKPKASKSK